MKTQIARIMTCWLALALGPAVTVQAGLTLASRGRTTYVIVQPTGVTPAETRAARDLADTLKQMTRAEFKIETAGESVPDHAILVGQGPESRAMFPEVNWERLGEEEIVVRTKGARLLLAGGRPRGTGYAVSWFLQQQCGVRWWTPWASSVPEKSVLRIPDLEYAYQPVFESRDPFWFTAFNREWAIRNFSNSQSAGLTEADGGSIRYKGFVHTFYSLVPPAEHFDRHPEWFSLLKGKRTHDHAQLCLSNPQLRDFVVERVRQWLRESPEARIVSVSQNDWYGTCECPECKKIDEAEGGPSGSMLAFVNYVAEKIAPDFPQVAVDTLAYQYTRRAPKTLRPLPNVIIRLCSIECNFAQPLEHPSNQDFARDIRDWSRVCQRLYIWDYTTDFAHYVQPHPNWFVLGPNVRFFRDHHVKGLFEQGAYQSHGSEMAELRAWVLARLLWNPGQDDRSLITEFLKGYYGPKASPFIAQYLDLMARKAANHKLTCFSSPEAPFLDFATLSEAERLWNKAEAAVKNEADLLWRIRQARLAPHYAWLKRWDVLQKECQAQRASWPFSVSRRELADAWLATATGPGPRGWSRMTHINESGLKPEDFVARIRKEVEAQP
ncbi:MAG TPA: DUF4838 domain-containing protein [Candidatus Paceibacterota bacterium]|nr:DUF4838 domain-containing protein [Verrucomicrobiota bacterium]HRY48613.1 DUF4838 domain-containing protein [Candidatus Paceibacterota bacterium]HSA01096.1 DUF4838 domain-containing protein [Candidatus Paceibacterota bacterium]